VKTPAPIALLLVALLAAPWAQAKDRVANIDEPVPALKDGRRIAVNDVEKSILEACKARRFICMVTEPGLISGRYVHNQNYLAEVSIPFSEQAFSIRYKDSVGMGYNAEKKKIKDDYNVWVEALAEHITAHCENALKRLKKQSRAGA
jgi:hypothetical protein